MLNGPLVSRSNSQVYKVQTSQAGRKIPIHGYGNVPAGFRLRPEPSGPVRPRQPTRPVAIDISSRFGSRVRQLRLARGLTQVAMARRFGIDRTYISDLERGKKSTTLEFIEILALGFGITMSVLMDEL